MPPTVRGADESRAGRAGWPAIDVSRVQGEFLHLLARATGARSAGWDGFAFALVVGYGDAPNTTSPV